MTSQLIRTRLHDGVAVAMIDNPPVNALSHALRRALWDKIAVLGQQGGVKAIVLIAEGDIFSAGADIRELDAPQLAPSLTDLANQLEACPVPVIAALQGPALGGGAELALACHYRIALKSASFGLPEVTLGLVTGAGGTQRLPRLVGAEAALDLMLGGRSVAAPEAQRLGLLDGVVDGHLPSAAVHFAKDILTKGRGPRPSRARRDRLSDGQSFLQIVAQRRQALGPSQMNAPKRIVDAVEAALLLPFDAGLDLERAAFIDCLGHDQSKALRHMFIAERRIDHSLLAKHIKGFRTVSDVATPIVERLRSALRLAVDHVATLGVAPARIDAALLQFGFTKAPFGGTSPVGQGRDIALIQRRCVAAMMAEGCRIVARGDVARASDIDALAVHGLGFPRYRGGPMKAAQLMGLLDLRAEMAKWALESRVWAVPALLDEAVKYADGFSALPDLKSISAKP